MLAARQRGVRVRILLPGPHIDSEAVRVSSKREWGDLLLGKVDIHEYQPTMLHSKMLIVDRQMVSVGSTNFDIRSFRLNDEASLNVYDKAFAERMGDDCEPKAWAVEKAAWTHQLARGRKGGPDRRWPDRDDGEPGQHPEWA